MNRSMFEAAYIFFLTFSSQIQLFVQTLKVKHKLKILYIL